MRLFTLALVFAASLLAPLGIAAENDPLRPPAIIATDVPVIPEDFAAALDRYTNSRAASFQGWAPDGTGILIATRFGNSAQLHRVHQPGGRREQITFYDEPVRGRFVPEHPKQLLLSMSRGGDENHQIYALDREKFQADLLTDGKSRNLLGPISDDGTRMVIGSNQRNGRDTDLYLTDPRQPGSLELIFPVDGEFWYAEDWSPDGEQLLLVRYVSANESYLARFDIGTRKKTDLPHATQDGSKVSLGPVAFAADGKSAYVTTDAVGEFTRLARLDFETLEYTWLTEDIDWDVADLTVDRKTGQVAFTVNEDGASRVFLLENDKPRSLELPLGIVADLEFSPDGKQLGFTFSRPDAPSDAYSLELETGKLTRWTYSEVGGLNPDSFVVPTRIRYRSFDEREIPAYYYRPAKASAEKPAPVLISIHGGPESQYRPYFSSQTQYYVSQGLAVIYPNVRGSSGYGKTYLTLDNAELREDSVRDIGALLDWIDEQPELDASRVAVSGGSYGGYMVLASLVHYGERIRAGIDVVGIANFITFLENTAAYRQDLRRAEYGDERDPKMREYFERISPAANAEKIRSALLVAHGVNDPRVPFSEAQQIAEKVRAQGRPVWTVYAENEGHGFAKKDNADYVRTVEALFLKTYLELSPQ